MRSITKNNDQTMNIYRLCASVIIDQQTTNNSIVDSNRILPTIDHNVELLFIIRMSFTICLNEKCLHRNRTIYE